jgi:hypothetical protein
MISVNGYIYSSVKQATEVYIDWQEDGGEAFAILIDVLFEKKVINTADLERLFKVEKHKVKESQL